MFALLEHAVHPTIFGESQDLLAPPQPLDHWYVDSRDPEAHNYLYNSISTQFETTPPGLDPLTTVLPLVFKIGTRWRPNRS
jgi:hypothetical protein